MMYSRSYISGEPREILPPENYDGNAFADRRVTEVTDTVPKIDAVNEEGVLPPLDHGVAVSNPGEATVKASADTRRSGSILSLFGGARTGLFNSFGPSRIGSEEILIIAVAAFLFLSRDGDKECALMLLLLLIVN